MRAHSVRTNKTRQNAPCNPHGTALFSQIRQPNSLGQFNAEIQIHGPSKLRIETSRVWQGGNSGNTCIANYA